MRFISSIILICVLLEFISSLENGVARTPPMGWLSWAQFYCNTDCVHSPLSCINENLYMDMADRLVADGFRDAGYEYVNVDDCWMSMERNADGTLPANSTRFPHGMKWLAKYMHDRGLKFGLYQDFGSATCAGYPGILNHLEIDAKTLASWDIDSLKIDGCNVNVSLMDEGFPEFGKFLNQTGRPILFSCEWPLYQFMQNITPNYEKIKQVCNQYRNYADSEPSWGSITDIINWYDKNQDILIPANGPGHWNDPDEMAIGHLSITIDQAKAQFSIWSIWSAPLLMSNDLRFITPSHKEILLNRKVIAIDQDPMGIMGRLIIDDKTNNFGVYVKPVIPIDEMTQKTSIAVVFFNRNSNKQVQIQAKLSNLNMTNPSGYIVEDLWSGDNLGSFMPEDELKLTVNATGVVMLKGTIIADFKKNLVL